MSSFGDLVGELRSSLFQGSPVLARILMPALIILIPEAAFAAVQVTDSVALAAAVRDGAAGTNIEIAAGTYELGAMLELKAGMTLKGAGIDKTILTHTKAWKPSTKTLPDPEMKLEGLDTEAYLIRIVRDTAGVTISDLTIRAPQLHGAIFAWFHTGLHLHHLKIQETLWCGIRTFGLQKSKILDCEFIDAGGRWDKGEPGLKGGNTGGAIFACWMADTEIAHNRFLRKRTGTAEEFYGIKGRQGTRCRIHHNTIETSFSIEFPFENDGDVEIDRNVCTGTISIPKYAGGVVPKSGRTFHIHHNHLKDGYSVEFVRNGVEIDHNLFDFDEKQDGSNLISAFGNVPAKGPGSFHNNLVRNPGRGVVLINEVYDNLDIRNNHIIARTTPTPRLDGLFGFNPKCDFKTIRIRDNIIECRGQQRPLVRNAESLGAMIDNNALTGISDAGKYPNAKADRKPGLEAPLKFTCGVRDEVTVDGWNTKPTSSK